jgi:pilus assembly protein CpaB
MKRGQIIGISVALGAAALAFFGMKSVLGRKPATIVQTETIDATEVLVARANIELGQIANEGNFRWQQWPREAVSQGFITKQARGSAMTDFSGAIARAPILQGEPITENKLIKAGSGGVLAAILPPGMRAISTRIKEETAVGKLILPNDHVDVILIRRMRSKSGTEEFVSDTLFRNVRVLAIGQQIEAKEGKKGAEGATATLELTPKQTELLALANSMGEISLSLRSVADLSGESGTGDLNNRSNKANSSVRVLRYGVKSRQYGVN